MRTVAIGFIAAFELMPSTYLPGFDASRITVTSIAFNRQA